MRKVAGVFLLAENRLLREALIRLLSKRNEFRIVGASSHSRSVQQEIISARPQIVLMDSSGSAEPKAALISSLRAAIRNLRFVMVDMEPDEEVLLKSIRAGAVGYILKDASAMEVAAAIREVAAGNAVCPAPLCMALFRYIFQHSPVPSDLSLVADVGLSGRERQMLEMLSLRLTNKEIAQRLGLSEQTVKNHVHHILRKTGASNRLAVIEFCQNQRLNVSVAVAGNAAVSGVAGLDTGPDEYSHGRLSDKRHLTASLISPSRGVAPARGRE